MSRNWPMRMAKQRLGQLVRMCRASVINRAIAIACLALAPTIHAQSSALPAGLTRVTAFVDVTVVPMDAERVLANHTVLITGGRIIALGPSTSVKVPKGAMRIDGRGKYLIPGLADMHVHLSWVTFPEMQYDSTAAERRLFLWLANGITTARNLDYRENSEDPLRSRWKLTGATLLRLRARAAAGELLSPRIYTSGLWAPRRYGGYIPPGEAAPRMDSVAVYVAAYKAAGFDFIKLHDEVPSIRDSLAATARRVGIPIMGHVDSLEGALEANYASIEHLTGFRSDLFSGGAGDSAGLRGLAEKVKKAGVWNCPTLLLKSDSSVRHPIVKALQQAGAGLLAGTDAPVNDDNRTHGDPGGLHRELRALVREGLTPYQALATATRNAAVFLQTFHESGTITRGKRADVVLLAANPLADIRHTQHPVGVMIGGRWLSRAELDRRLAVLTPQEWEERYWRLVREVFRWAFHTAPTSMFAEHVAQRRALMGELGVEADSTVGDRRVLQLLARQLGEFRAVLHPDHQVRFDQNAREWTKKYATKGYAVEIVGVRE